MNAQKKVDKNNVQLNNFLNKTLGFRSKPEYHAKKYITKINDITRWIIFGVGVYLQSPWSVNLDDPASKKWCFLWPDSPLQRHFVPSRSSSASRGEYKDWFGGQVGG